MNKPEVFCDLNQKKWLNVNEAIAYLGFGSKSTFQIWREGVMVGTKMIFLKYYKTGKHIVYKRSDIDLFMEQYNRGR